MTGRGPHFDAACDFCAIAQRDDSNVDVVAQSDAWIAFFPLEPATPGHTLVVPRTHVADLWSLEQPLHGEMMTALVEVGRAIRAGLEPEGMNLISSAGVTAEQTVFHLHFHLVPRWTRDGFGRIWPLDSRYEDAELTDIAARIRDRFAARP